MTSQHVQPQSTGYMRITELQRANDVVCLYFEHTLTDNRAVKTAPMIDASPQWVLEAFHSVNQNYPDAMDHVAEVQKWCRRFI